MSDDQALRDFVSEFHYDPVSAVFPARPFPPSVLTKEVVDFIALWTRGKGPRLNAYDLSHLFVHDVKVLAAYRHLSDAGKANVLIIATSAVHEFTHHFDLIQTPFGANFHIKLFEEYVFILENARTLMEMFTRVLSAPRRPAARLADGKVFFDVVSDPSAEAIWNQLPDGPAFFCILAFFDIFNGHAIRDMARGWDTGDEVVPSRGIMNDKLELVTLHSWCGTFFLPLGAPGRRRYFSPTTILEAHAVANALAWVSFAFDDDDEGVREVQRYLQVLYPADETIEDYHYLFNLIARWALPGFSDFQTSFASLTLKRLRSITGTVSAVTWYALHAMPPTEDSPGHMSAFAGRLMSALAQTDEDVRRRLLEGLPDGTLGMNQILKDFYDSVDNRHKANWPVKRILEATAHRLQVAIEDNKRRVTDPSMRKHFDQVLSAIRHHLTKRSDYGLPPGFTWAGRPFPGPGTSDATMDALLPDYDPPEAVRKWAVLRKGLFYRCPSTAACEELARRFLGAA